MVNGVMPYSVPEDEVAPAVPYTSPENFTAKAPPISDSTAKQTALMASKIAPGTDEFATYERVKGELLNAGESETLNTVSNFLTSEKNIALRRVFNEKLLDKSLNATKLKDYAKVISQMQKENLEKVPDLRAHFAKLLASRPVENQTKTETIVRSTLLDNVNKEIEAREKIEEIVQGHLGKIAAGQGTMEALAEGVETFFVPFYDNYQHAEMWRRMKGDKAGIKRAMLTGSLREELSTEFNKIPPRERVEFTQRTAEAIGALPGIFQADNSYQTHLMMTDIFVNPDKDPNDIDWDKWIYNATGLIDIWAVSSMALSGARGIRRLVKGRTPAEIIAETNPSDLERIWKESVKDPSGEVDAAHGATKEELVNSYGLPKSELDPIKPGPDLAATAEKDSVQEKLRKLTETQGYLYTPAEKAAAVADEQKKIAQANGATFSPAKSTLNTAVEADGEKIRINAAFTLTDHHGFPTALEARTAARQNGYHDEVVTVYKRNYKTGQYEPHDPTADTGKVVFSVPEDNLLNLGEDWSDIKKAAPGAKNLDDVVVVPTSEMDAFLAEINRLNNGGREYKLTSSTVDSDLGEFMFVVDDTRPYFYDDASRMVTGDVSARNVVTRTALPPDSKFSSFISGTALRAQDTVKAVQGTLMRIVKDEWFALGDGEKLLVNKMLRDGEAFIDEGGRRGRWWDETDIKANYPDATEKTVQMYRAARTLADTMYVLATKRLRRDMIRRNVLTIENTGTGFLSAGARMERGAFKAETVMAFDPVMGTLRSMGRGEVDELYARGGYVARLEEAWEGAGKKSALAVVDASQGTKISNLPTNVLRYTEGYFPRIYGKPYIIRRVRKSGYIDDLGIRDDVESIATAETKGDADAFTNKMSLEAPKGTHYEVFHDISIRSGAERFKADQEALKAEGRMFYSRRKDPLFSVEPSANTVDPMEAFQRGVAVLSNQVALEPWVAAAKRRFVAEYARFLPDNADRLSNEQIYKAIDDPALITSKEAGEAKTMWQYIMLMDGAEDEFTAAWRGWMVHLGEWLDGMGAKKLGKTALDIRDNSSPISGFKTLASTMFITGNPFRQRVLQALQATFVAPMDPVYFFGKMQTDHKAMLFGLATRDNEKLWPTARAMFSKVTGRTEKEFEELVDAFRESGFIEGVDSHIFVSGSLAKEDLKVAATSWGRYGTRMVDIAKLPLRAAKRYGFDSGEISQLIGTWLMSINDYKKANPNAKLANKTDLDQINIKTRQWSLAMNKAGMARYQRGAFSALTQFYAVQQKALFAMLPEALGGSRSFSARDKRKIALGQAIMYGAPGLGVLGLWEAVRDEAGLELDEDLNRAIGGGLMDAVINKSIEYSTGTATDLQIAADFAPASGSIESAHSIAEMMLSGDNKVWLGASASAGSRLMDVGALAAAAVNPPELDTMEKVLRVTSIVPEVFSGYNNYVKGKAMLKYGHLLEASGRMTPVVIEREEAIAKALFGVRTVAEHDFYKMATSVKEEKKDLDETADEFTRRINQIAVRFGNEGNYDYDRYHRALQQEAELFRVLDPWAAAYVREKVIDKVFSDKGAVEGEFAKNLTNLIYAGGVDDMQYIRTRVANASNLTPEQKAEVLKAIDYASEPNEMYKQAQEQK